MRPRVLNKGGQLVFSDGGRLAKTWEIVCPWMPSKQVKKIGLKLWSPESGYYALSICISICD